MAEICWWIALGYPPFDPGKNGFPRTGQVVKYYRERKKDHNGKPYTQSALAHVLRISEQCMRDIENRDLAMNYERRHFLSELLDIPPILFGIRTIDEILKLVEREQLANNAVTIISTPARTGVKLVIDVEEYRGYLLSSWNTNNRRTAYGSMTETQVRIDALYRELPHVRDKQPQFQKLLCEYHQFVANLLRDQQNYDGSIEHLDKAMLFAEQLNEAELKASVLHRRGYILIDADRINEAIHAYQDARQYKNLPVSLRGSILLQAGLADAKDADTNEKGKNAIRLIDQVGNMVRTCRKDDDPYFLKLNLNRYHLDKSTALIAIGKNQDAIDELQLVTCGTEYPRGQAYKDILLAQAYINKGQYGRGISSAESALDIVLEIDSKVNLARIIKIYHQLQKSPYQNSPDVARLAYSLRKK